MPQERRLLQRDAGWQVEGVRFLAHPDAWGPSHTAATTRWVLQTEGAIDILGPQGLVLLDGLTLLRLPRAMPYRLRSHATPGRQGVVVSRLPASSTTAERAAPELRGWLLELPQLWSLRRHWQALRRGCVDMSTTPALLRAALAGARSLPAGGWPASVVQAQRFIALRVAGSAGGGGQRWRLEDVADAVGLSPFHLARSFRRHTGLGLHGYRQHLRLLCALQRLEEGEQDLAGLAHDAGFSSQSHMGAAFRAAWGLTPARMRAELAGGAT